MRELLVAVVGFAGMYLLLGGKKRELAVPVEGLPDARRITEGYVLGALPYEEHVDAMRAHGIKAVLSLVTPPRETQEALAEAGIYNVVETMGSSFEPRHVRAIDDITSRFRPEEIYIHCTHGVDRSGATAAYLLATRHGWRLDDALWSVVAPTEGDTRGLSALLASRNMKALPPKFTSINSRLALGSTGGMKVGVPFGDRTNPGYSELINTTIDEFERRSGR